MTALFLGSIGTLSDTSELQREAFNEAFAQHDLDWTWDREAYREMLKSSGGKARIEAQAKARGVEVDAGAIHATKSEIFQQMLDDGRAETRPGLRDALDAARLEGGKLGFVTTTSRENVDRLLAGLGISPRQFDVITSREDVADGKPAPDVFLLAAARIGVAPEDCTVIEDNTGGVRAARAAGMRCFAWPNANTVGHDFGDAPVLDGPLPTDLVSRSVDAT